MEEGVAILDRIARLGGRAFKNRSDKWVSRFKDGFGEGLKEAVMDMDAIGRYVINRIGWY